MTKLGKTYYAVTDGPWANRINSETLDTEEYLDFVKLLGINASTAHPHFGKVIYLVILEIFHFSKC